MKRALLFISAAFISAMGIRWAFVKGADDFRVFHSAWQLVLQGYGMDVYDFRKMPDRFLYAPGFAWILAPLGLLSFNSALAVWSVSKFAALLLILRHLANRFGEGATALGFLFLARPILIDFQYGQVNVWILFFTYFALNAVWSHPEQSPVRRFFTWFGFTLISIAKVFSAPLLGISFLSRKNKAERIAVGLAVFLLILLPVLSIGVSATWGLHESWLTALHSRGLPLDSHNQSFAAFLLRWFTGQEIRVIPWGPKWVSVGKNLISESVLKSFSAAWFLMVMAWIGWIALQKRNRGPSGAELLVALSFLPSHLIWKPYFLLGIPLYTQVIHDCLTHKKKGLLAVFGALFLFLNFSSVDFVGYYLSGIFEVSSVFLWVHLLFCFFGTKLFHQQAS